MLQLKKEMKDAHIHMMRKLTRARPCDMKMHEERLNKMPIFGIQVAGN